MKINITPRKYNKKRWIHFKKGFNGTDWAWSFLEFINLHKEEEIRMEYSNVMSEIY